MMTPAELTALRKSLNLSQKAFALAIGASGGRTVRKWEKGERAISETVARLAATLAKPR